MPRLNFILKVVQRVRLERKYFASLNSTFSCDEGAILTDSKKEAYLHFSCIMMVTMTLTDEKDRTRQDRTGRSLILQKDSGSAAVRENKCYIIDLWVRQKSTSQHQPVLWGGSKKDALVKVSIYKL